MQIIPVELITFLLKSNVFICNGTVKYEMSIYLVTELTSDLYLESDKISAKTIHQNSLNIYLYNVVT